MATIEFTEPSPYDFEQRKGHHTDYIYSRFQKDADICKSKPGSQPQAKRHSVALFGIGRAGLIHFVNILSNRRLHLKYVVEADINKFEGLQKEYCLYETQYLPADEGDVAFNDPGIDGVIIATPTFTHEEIATKALKAGKAVLCEKPISKDDEGTRRCYNIAKEMKKPLLCAFNRRYEPSFREVYHQVRAGKIGRAHLIKTVSRDSPLPPLEYLKISGGIFHDCGVHDIDVICWILGEYPEKVFATASTFIPEIKSIGDYDTVAMILTFPSGAIGMVDLSRHSVYGYDQRLEVFGAKGMLNASNERPISVSYSTITNESQPPIFHSFPSRYQEGYKMELQEFISLMKGNNMDDASGENTLKVSKIASALEESAKTGKMISVQYS